MDALPVTPFGALLRRHRLAAGLSQGALAEQSHLSREAVSTLERGTRRAPRRETIDLLAAALHLSAAERALLHAAARDRAAAEAPLAPPRGEALAIAARLPLAGRQPELARLERHLARDEPPLLLLAGEPGMGKTRLLHEASRRAGAHGWTVLEGGCHRRSGQEPFAPLLGALEDSLRRSPPARRRALLEGCAWLVRLLPELAETALVPAPSWSLPPEQERRLVFAAVARHLANVAGPSGTLLILDDLQWAGDDALGLLESLVRSNGEGALRILGAYRSTEVGRADPLSAVLGDLAAAGLAAQHPLGPLAQAEARAMLESVLKGGDDIDIQLQEEVLARAGGVPFFLVSCAQALRGGAPADGGVPWTAAESIRRRVAAVPPSAQEMLGLAAVVGRRAERALLLQVASSLGHEIGDVIAAVEALGQARLLVEEQAGVHAFPHDLIREAVLADLSGARRASLHRRVAETLERGPGEAPVERLADHYLRAGDPERAIPYLRQAAERAQARHAHSEADGQYRRLIERLEVLGRREEADRAREQLGAVLLAAAHYEQALGVLDQAAAGYRAGADREGVARATAHIGVAHALHGTFAEGIARVQAFLSETISPPLSAQALALLYDALAQLFQRSARYAEQLTAAERACAYAEVAQDAQLLARGKSLYGLALAYLNRTDEAIPWLEAELPLLRASGDLWRLSHVLGALSWLYVVWGDSRRVQDYAAQAQMVARQIDNPHLLPEAVFFQALHSWIVGDWDQCRAQLELARALLEEAPDPWIGAQVLAGLGCLHLSRGQAQGGLYLDEARRLIEHPFIEWLVVINLSEHDLVRGDAAAAAARLAPLLEGSSTLVGAVQMLMGWATLERDPGKAAELIAQGSALASSSQSQRGQTDGLRIKALLAIRQQRWPDAERALETALPVTRAIPCPYEEAKALYIYGLLHQAKGEPERARARLEAALAILNRLRERVYAERVEAALAQLAAG